MSAPLWPSGVGGMQCEECGQTTIVRAFGDYMAGDPLDEAVRWLCRECVEGGGDEA